MFNPKISILKKIIPALLILVMIISCKSEVKPITFKTEDIKEAFEADISVSYDKAIGNGENAKAINKTIVQELLKTLPTTENYTTLKAAVIGFDKEFKAFITAFEDEKQTWSLNIETEVLYQTPELISVAISTYSDTGGAHGNDSIQFLNFKPSNGEQYTNADIFEDLEGFNKIAESYFLEAVKPKDESISDYFFGKSFQLPKNISFNEEGIILLYNVYEIASYSQGYTEFVIPMEVAKPFLKLF